MTDDPAGAGRRADLDPDLDPGPGLDAREDAAEEAAARRRHPSTHPWRTDHDGLAVRLAAHLEAAGWTPTAAHAVAAEARETVRRP